MKGCLQVQSVLLEKSGKVGLQLSFKLATFFLFFFSFFEGVEEN